MKRKKKYVKKIPRKKMVNDWGFRMPFLRLQESSFVERRMKENPNVKKCTKENIELCLKKCKQ